MIKILSVLSGNITNNYNLFYKRNIEVFVQDFPLVATFSSSSAAAISMGFI